MTSFLIDERLGSNGGLTEVVTTYVSSSSKHHYLCLHWISETRTTKTGWVRDGKVTFLELIVYIGTMRKTFVLVGDDWEPCS